MHSSNGTSVARLGRRFPLVGPGFHFDRLRIRKLHGHRSLQKSRVGHLTIEDVIQKYDFQKFHHFSGALEPVFLTCVVWFIVFAFPAEEKRRQQESKTSTFFSYTAGLVQITLRLFELVRFRGIKPWWFFGGASSEPFAPTGAKGGALPSIRRCMRHFASKIVSGISSSCQVNGRYASANIARVV